MRFHLITLREVNFNMFDRGSIFWCFCFPLDILAVITVAYAFVTNFIKSETENKDEDTKVSEDKEGR